MKLRHLSLVAAAAAAAAVSAGPIESNVSSAAAAAAVTAATALVVEIGFADWEGAGEPVHLAGESCLRFAVLFSGTLERGVL